MGERIPIPINGSTGPFRIACTVCGTLGIFHPGIVSRFWCPLCHAWIPVYVAPLSVLPPGFQA